MKSVTSAIALMIATIAQPAQAAVEGCLVDTWIADMMALQMAATAVPVGGEVSMEIAADGSFTLLADDMIVNVVVPGTPAMDVKVVGYSAGQFDAADNVFLATVGDYNLVGSANVLGQVMEIPFSSATGLGGGGSGWFECAGDTLRFEVATGGAADANRMPRLWQRR